MHLHRRVEISSEANSSLSEVVGEKHYGLTEINATIVVLVKCLVWCSPEADPDTRVQGK